MLCIAEGDEGLAEVAGTGTGRRGVRAGGKARGAGVGRETGLDTVGGLYDALGGLGGAAAGAGVGFGLDASAGKKSSALRGADDEKKGGKKKKKKSVHGNDSFL